MLSKVLTLAEKLIAIESIATKPDELRRIVDLCALELKEFTVEKFEKNSKPSLLVYAKKVRPKKFDLLLNAHLDVIPGKNTQFSAYVQGDKFFGRGSADMKAAAAAEIIVFKELAKSSRAEIGLQLVTDEEIGGFNGSLYQLEEGVRSNFVIAGEPSMLSVNKRAKGVLKVAITTQGRASHSAYPWKGKNALWRLIDVLNQLHQYDFFPELDKWQSTMNLAKVSTENTAINTVPDTAQADFDIRYTVQEKTQIKQALKKSCGNIAQFKIDFDDPAYDFTDKKDASLQLLEKIRDKYFTLPGPVIKHGASDIRHFAKYGMTGVTFGPIGYNAHADGEYVEITSLEIFYRVLSDFLSSLKKSNLH